MKANLHQIIVLLGSILLLVGTALSQNRTPRSDTKPDTARPLPEEVKESTTKIIESTIQESLDIELDGLIIDQTLTKSGRDFYEMFYGGWQPPTVAKNFTINIKEIPWQGRVQLTRLSVSINEIDVVTLPLQPRYDLVEQAVKYALARAYNYLLNYEQIQLDLRSEDQQGTGIF